MERLCLAMGSGPGGVESRDSPTGPWATEEAEVKVCSEPFLPGPLEVVGAEEGRFRAGGRAGLTR